MVAKTEVKNLDEVLGLFEDWIILLVVVVKVVMVSVVSLILEIVLDSTVDKLVVEVDVLTKLDEVSPVRGQ